MMNPTPHALFTRNVYGTTVTIEINSLTYGATRISKVNGVETKVRLGNVLEFRKGMVPHWSYVAGFDKEPVWHDQYRSAYAATPGSHSYITLLRMAVAQLTSGGMGFMSGVTRKPKLGFHSKYKAMKRAQEDSARMAKAV